MTRCYDAKDAMPDGVDPMGGEAVIEHLESHIDHHCDDEQLEATLGNANVYGYYSGSNRLKELRFLLFAYETSLEEQKEDLHFDAQNVVNSDSGRISIEHVWPQTPDDRFDEATQAAIEEHKHRLGNLALMTREDNAARGNDPFHEKRADFEGSKFRMLEEIFETEDWGVDQIEDRERRILEAIKQRWPNGHRE